MVLLEVISGVRQNVLTNRLQNYADVKRYIGQIPLRVKRTSFVFVSIKNIFGNNGEPMSLAVGR